MRRRPAQRGADVRDRRGAGCQRGAFGLVLVVVVGFGSGGARLGAGDAEEREERGDRRRGRVAVDGVGAGEAAEGGGGCERGDERGAGG
jgi:hypothetical protein